MLIAATNTLPARARNRRSACLWLSVPTPPKTLRSAAQVTPQPAYPVAAKTTVWSTDRPPASARARPPPVRPLPAARAPGEDGRRRDGARPLCHRHVQSPRKSGGLSPAHMNDPTHQAHIAHWFRPKSSSCTVNARDHPDGGRLQARRARRARRRPPGRLRTSSGCASPLQHAMVAGVTYRVRTAVGVRRRGRYLPGGTGRASHRATTPPARGVALQA